MSNLSNPPLLSDALELVIKHLTKVSTKDESGYDLTAQIDILKFINKAIIATYELKIQSHNSK